ncbi:hypothetical protein [Nocardia concava]|uniref:hypothetical protein n=1 Tax=Nocardia concava TaxID=257281 RepID=UPI0003115BE1|nr:hypothetical protein [Nocardia concava]
MAKISLRLDDDLAAAAKDAGQGNLTAYIARAVRHELIRDELAAQRKDARIADAEAEAAADHDAAVDAYLRELGR